ncbi:hypothetical protein LJB86_05990, partial [Deltaproteobacteria bacterium OttesenSCG-928-M10]|nr:hypothetical protein [Deltaproteobacteria bacterium OttesenSCG-928-M10]
EFYYSQDDAFYQTAEAVLPEVDKLFREGDENLRQWDGDGQAELQSISKALQGRVDDLKKQMEASRSALDALRQSRGRYLEFHERSFNNISAIYDELRALSDAATERGDQATAERMGGYMGHLDGLWDNTEQAKVMFWQAQALRDRQKMDEAVELWGLVAQALADMAAEPQLDATLQAYVRDLQTLVPASRQSLNQFIEAWDLAEEYSRTLATMSHEMLTAIAGLYQKTETLTLAGMGIPLYVPPLAWCADNAAMIAALGARQLAAGENSLAPAAEAYPRWPVA